MANLYIRDGGENASQCDECGRIVFTRSFPAHASCWDRDLRERRNRKECPWVRGKVVFEINDVGLTERIARST